MQRLFPSAGRLDRFSAALERWHAPEGLRQVWIPALVGGCFLATALIVYATGGTKYAHAHLFYVPILLAAFGFGLPGGIAGGFLAGLIAGPFMPLDVAGGIPQSASNWLARAVYFTLIGALAGGLCGRLSAQIRTIRRYGYCDPLTGLPNKAALREHLDQALAQRRAEPLVLIRLQILGFEDINAAFGYRMADALLQIVAQRMTRVLPAGSTPYHLYAAHFGILCRAGPGSCEAAAVAQALVSCLREPAVVEALPIAVEARIGLARYPEHAGEPHALLRAATFALYDAEASARETRTYDPTKHREQRHAIGLLADLRGAIDEGQLVLVYQPKVSVRSGACLGVEALTRWHHPRHGLVPPGQFIANAERTTMVKPLTEWVLSAAIEQLVSWRDAGLDLAVAVNVSVRNIEDPEFPEFLRALMARHGIASDRLELEITESAIMVQADQALAALQTLKELQVKIAIDDFGTGQSSLSYLRELPADLVKIDRSFIRRLTEEPKNRKIVRAAIDLAHDMDLEVVAEGVETGEVLDYLRTFGCDTAQGYLICPPLEPADLGEWLRGRALRQGSQLQPTAPIPRPRRRGATRIAHPRPTVE